MPVKKPASTEVNLVPLRTVTGVFTVEGTSPLIVHNWSHKAKQEMLDKQTGRAKVKKAPKDPDEDFNSSRYLLDGGWDGFPAVAFKAAIVGAARLFDSITMTELRQAIYVAGEGIDMLVPIIGTPEIREDMVRIGPGTADIRYRACYWPWSVQLNVTWVSSQFTAEQMVSLIDAAGIGGVGEWRPSKAASGQFGKFRVAAGEVLS